MQDNAENFSTNLNIPNIADKGQEKEGYTNTTKLWLNGTYLETISEQVQNKNMLQGLQNKSTMCTKCKAPAK